MLWYAVSKEKVVEPYSFYGRNMNCENCRNIVIHYSLVRFSFLREDCIFHQDSAPANYTSFIIRYKENKTPDNWIGEGELVTWAALSLDLTSSDFFLWRRFKEKCRNNGIVS